MEILMVAIYICGGWLVAINIGTSWTIFSDIEKIVFFP